MKRIAKQTAVILLSLLLFLPALTAVFYYTNPMEDVSYPLFTLVNDGEEWGGANGWQVYTNEKGTIQELISDGTGGYFGSIRPGQTFYYSRRLTEAAESPTLKIGAANRTVSVFLDHTLIYTDCPDLDNRIGYLTLPMLEYDRAEPVTFSLPQDYAGKTLTIAQSSPAISDKQGDSSTVWPCEVTLYCGYAYESGLISSAAKALIPAGLLFALELLLLASFILNAFQGLFFWQLPVFALAVLLQLCSILLNTDFSYQYIGPLPIDAASLCSDLSVGALFLLLGLYTRKFRLFFLIMTALHWSACLFSPALQAGFFLEYGDLYLFFVNLPKITGFLFLALSLPVCFYLCRQGNHFFCHYSRTFLTLTACLALFLAAAFLTVPETAQTVLNLFRQEFALLLPNLSLRLLWDVCLLSCLLAVLQDQVRQAGERRHERKMLALRNRMAIESYENLYQQSEEIRILRHDTIKHYHLLQVMAQKTPEKIPAYLEELIGQAQAVRPVISSQNQTLNILLNGKLNAAAARGITIELKRCDAPAALPLTDSQLCCLVVNILDNAIEASSACENGWIRLDFHCKGQLFVFSCENSRPFVSAKRKEACSAGSSHRKHTHLQPGSTAPQPDPAGSAFESDQNFLSNNKKSPRKNRGYGLKIIRQIMQRFGDHMLFIEESKEEYKLTFILPLS